MKKTGRKLFALLLALVLAVSMLATSAFADEAEPGGDLGTTGPDSSSAPTSSAPTTQEEYEKEIERVFNKVIGEINQKDSFEGVAVLGNLDLSDRTITVYVENSGGNFSSLMLDATLQLVKGLYVDETTKSLVGFVQSHGNHENCAAPGGNCVFTQSGRTTLKFGDGGIQSESYFDTTSDFRYLFYNLSNVGGGAQVTLEEALNGGYTLEFELGFNRLGTYKPEDHPYTIKFERLETGGNVLEGTDDDVKLEGSVGSSEFLTGSGLRNGASGKSATNILDMLKDKENWSVETADKEPVDTSEPVGTGYVLKHTVNGVTVEEITIVVPGDVDGDASISAEDCTAMLNHIGSGGHGLEGAYEKASHVRGESGDLEPDDVVMALNIAASV